MDIRRQIELGYLVCPATRQTLVVDERDRRISSVDGATHYRLRDGVPLLVKDAGWQEEYASDSSRMNEEYAPSSLHQRQSWINRIKAWLTQDYRTEESRRALESIFHGVPADALCLSIGGGPTRAHPRLVNLNIGAFPNVDAVMDAHNLSYADECVDAIHCDAVLEHLHDPLQAAREMHRVLKPGAKAYICTPFMQGYHGYPHHYQNFSFTGHQHLFRSAGLRVVEAGVCVGPVYTMVSFISVFLYEYVPRPLNLPLRYAWGLIGALLRPLDKIVATRKNAHVLASTTYVVVEKPR